MAALRLGVEFRLPFVCFVSFAVKYPARPGVGRWPFAPDLASGQMFGLKRQRAGALQDASRGSFAIGPPAFWTAVAHRGERLGHPSGGPGAIAQGTRRRGLAA